MKDILIRLDAAEALTALGAIEDKALDASRLAAISTGDEHEIADLSAKILQRLATRLVDALYPTHCDRGHELCTDSCGNCPTCFMHEKECTFWARFDPLAAIRREDVVDEIEFGLT